MSPRTAQERPTSRHPVSLLLVALDSSYLVLARGCVKAVELGPFCTEILDGLVVEQHVCGPALTLIVQSIHHLANLQGMRHTQVYETHRYEDTDV